MSNTKKDEEPLYFLVKIFLDRISPEPKSAEPLKKFNCESFQKEYYNCMISPEPTCLVEFENLTKCMKEHK